MKIIAFLAIFFWSYTSYANVIGADTQNFNPDYGHNDFVTVRSSAPIPRGHFNLTFFADYSSETLPVYSEETSPTTVDKADLGDSAVYTHVGIGLGVLDWLDIGASFPYIVNQTVDSSVARGEFAKNGSVEMRFAAKVRLFQFEDKSGGFSFQPSIGINQVEYNPFIGNEPGPTINFEFILDKKIGRLNLSGNLGYRMRDPGVPNKEIGGIWIEPNDDILIASAGAAYSMSDDLSLVGELWAAWPDDGQYGGVAVYRDKSIYEALAGLKYKTSDKLNFHAGVSAGVNHGLSTPTYRLYGGLNWMFGPLWAASQAKPKRARKLKADISYYDPGFRQGYMAGFGIGPYANMGADYGEELDGGKDYAEGFYDGYAAAGSPFPEEVVAKTPYSNCYRTGFQGKIGNGPAEGQGLGYGEVLGLGVECSEGYDQGWTDAPDRAGAKESFYNPGYREGYKAGYGIGPYAGLGPNHGESLNGGFEFPQGFRDGYNDAMSSFPGSDDTRTYGKGYRLGFQGKLGKGPGKGTGPNFGSSINPEEPFPAGFEHGWIDSPEMESLEPDPVTLDAGDANAFDNLEAQKEENIRLENVLFDTNSYRLRQESMAVLDSLARHLRKGSGFRRLVVEGHTDSDGAAAYNEKLSIQRAMSVKAYLVQVHGLEGEKIIADGWGERRPVVPNTSAANKQKNRRVEFKISRD